MGFETFIARKILTSKSGNRRMTNPIIKVATGGIALGMAVMLLAVMVVTGFRNEITNKVIGFGAHLRINNFDSNNSYEESPISSKAEFIDELRKDPHIEHVQQYATKAGIIKTNEEIQGVVLKGVSDDYNWEFFKEKIVEGRIIQFKDSSSLPEVMISLKTARNLSLKTGDDMVVYFIEQPPRIRKLKIKGIYETGLDEFDNLYAYCNIDIIRKLNNWSSDQAGGIEIMLTDFDNLDEMNDVVYATAGYQYYTQSVKEQYPQIFHWLELQNVNVIIIITLILLVAGISMISTLLIIILENSGLIGILKSMGSSDRSIRKLFIYIAVPVIGRGLIAGNILGLILAALQWKFGLVTLPQESYYVSQVPINFSLWHLLILNGGTILACFLMLIGPSMVISKISPAKVIRFE